MSNTEPSLGRLINGIWVSAAKNLTHWAIVGTIIAATGFGPEHWFATVLHYIKPPLGNRWPAWLDIRAVIVCVGVAIVVGDVLLRRRALRREQQHVGNAPGNAAPANDRASAIDSRPSASA